MYSESSYCYCMLVSLMDHPRRTNTKIRLHELMKIPKQMKICCHVEYSENDNSVLPAGVKWSRYRWDGLTIR